VDPTPVRTVEEMSAYVQTALGERVSGSALPFALLDTASGRVIGSTHYGNIDRVHHRLEIGWTWVARQWQRTAINTEAKYLLLRHAFETLKCIRVELKTDSLNERSRAAILRIGARERRNFSQSHDHRKRPHPAHRLFQHLDSEWPEVRTRLESKLR